MSSDRRYSPRMPIKFNTDARPAAARERVAQMKKLFFVAGAILTAVLVTTVPARAKTVECVGTITGVIDANVVVPPGQICILLSAEVNGWVTVGENADL